MALFRSKKQERISDLEDTVQKLSAQIGEYHNIKLSEMSSWSDLLTTLRGKHASGVLVSPETAMQSSAVYACVSLIAGVIASLPLDVFQRGGGTTREKKNDHRVAPLIRKAPEPAITAMMFWETVLWWVLLRGNAFAIIHRVGAQPSWIEFQHSWPHQIKKDRDTGRLSYTFDIPGEGIRTFDQDDVLHFSSFGWTGTHAKSAIESGGFQAVGGALAADEHAAGVIGAGGLQQLGIQYPKKVDEEQQKLLRDYFVRAQKNNPHAPRIVTEGGEIKTLTISPSDLQLLETRRYNTTDCCRIFGVPPVLIGEGEKNTTWGSGIEEIIRGFVRFTVAPHLKRLESEIDRKLFTGNSNRDVFAEFNLEGLLRGDTKTRHESYNIARGGNQLPGFMTTNEIRAKENLPPIPGGDVLYVPVQGDTNDEAESESDDEPT